MTKSAGGATVSRWWHSVDIWKLCTLMESQREEDWCRTLGGLPLPGGWPGGHGGTLHLRRRKKVCRKYCVIKLGKKMNATNTKLFWPIQILDFSCSIKQISKVNVWLSRMKWIETKHFCLPANNSGGFLAHRLVAEHVDERIERGARDSTESDERAWQRHSAPRLTRGGYKVGRPTEQVRRYHLIKKTSESHLNYSSMKHSCCNSASYIEVKHFCTRGKKKQYCILWMY